MPAILLSVLWGCSLSGTPKAGAPPSAEPVHATKPLAQRADGPTAGATEDYIIAALGDAPRFRVDGRGRPCAGPEDAPVTIVEYVDFECPFTRRVELVVEQLLKAYEGKVRLCTRHNPIHQDHPNALLAAHAAEEVFARKGAEAFVAIRKDLLSKELTAEGIVALVERQGIDLARFKDAVSRNTHGNTIAADVELLHRMDASGTPEFFINGRRIGGAKPYEAFAAVVDDEITRMSALVRAGVSPEQLFSTVLAHSLGSRAAPPALPGEPAAVRIRFIHICHSGQGATAQARSRDEALMLAKDIRQRIQKGADFEDLARRYSNASNAQSGGAFGWLRRGTLTPEADSTALALTVGELSDVVDQPGCFSLIQRLE